MLNDLRFRNCRQHIHGSDSCGRRKRRGLGAVPMVGVERRVVTVVGANVLVVRRGVDDDFSLVVTFYRPRWVEVIEGMEERGDEMHRHSAQEDEEDIANEPGSSQAMHPES